jgi:hypothetical protein
LTSEAGEAGDELQPAERRRRVQAVEFSSAASDEVEKLTKGYQQRLEKRSRQIARDRQLDVVSRIHVRRAGEDLGDLAEPKRFRIFSDLRALLGGGGFAAVLTLVVTHAKLDAELRLVSGAPIAVGIACYLYGLAGTKKI